MSDFDENDNPLINPTGFIQNDPAQQAIDSIGLNVSNQTGAAPSPAPAPRQQDDDQARQDTPHGDSTLVGQGVNHVFRNADIPSAAMRGLDSVILTEAVNGYNVDPNTGNTRYGSNTVTADIVHANSDTTYSFSSMQSSVATYSPSELSGMAERVTTRFDSSALDRLTNSHDGANSGFISDDGRVINALRDSYDARNGATINLSRHGEDLLMRSSDTAMKNAYDPLSHTVTLTTDQLDALDHFMTASKVHEQNVSSTAAALDRLSDQTKWENASDIEKQETITLIDTIKESDRRYRGAHARVEQARMDMGKAVTEAEKRDASEALKAAQADWSKTVSEADGVFKGSAEKGDNGHTGRVDLAFRATEHMLHDETGADFTGNTSREALMRARGAYFTGRAVVSAGKDMRINRLDKKADKARRKGDTEKADALKRRSDNFKEERKTEHDLERAEHGDDIESLSDARKALTDARDIRKKSDREARYVRSDRRTIKRRKRKGESDKAIEGRLKDKRKRRKVRDTKRKQRSDKRRSRLDRLQAPFRMRERFHMEIRRRWSNLAFVRRFRNSSFGRFLKGFQGITQKIRGFFMKLAMKALVAMMPIILGILAFIAVGSLILFGICMGLEMFVGDDGDGEAQATEDTFTGNYQELISSLRQTEIDWVTDVQTDATQSAIDHANSIKKKVAAKGVKTYEAFDPTVYTAHTGEIVDEYGNTKVSMGNYIPNFLMAKYRVQTDIKNNKDHPVDGNLDKISEYIAYLWGGDEDSDSDNWTGRHSDTDDPDSDLGTDLTGKKKYEGKVSEDTRWSKEYSYQNYDPAAEHWQGDNHQVMKKPYTMTYRGKNEGSSQVVVTEPLNANWLTNKLAGDPEVSIQFWRHENLSECDTIQYHGDSGHDMGTSPDGDCDHYHSARVCVGYGSDGKGHTWPIYETHYFCDGHCPGHCVPIIDYQFIGNIDNLCAFDDKPINDLHSTSARWAHWWAEKTSGIARFFSFGGKVDNVFTEFLNGVADLAKLKADALNVSGESYWDHWSDDDMKFLHETGGTYDTGYTEGKELLKYFGVDVGSLDNSSWSMSDISSYIIAHSGKSGFNGGAVTNVDLSGIVFSNDPVDAAAQQKVIAAGVQICNDPNVGYRMKGPQAHGLGMGKPYYDCSSFAWTVINEGGFNMPVNTSAAEYKWLAGKGVAVSLDNLQPGDLIFKGSSPSSIHHVEVYIGNGQCMGAHGCTGSYAFNKQSQVSVKPFKKANWQFAARPLALLHK